ncbi:metallophosphoesterase [Brevundimonas sp. SORGH_AS_0993]|uniref:metallophosphoesterase n=1 Tax=Brevundimonas sp. SORGH_AS_0993 TaxID=3041794 RepID=UPI0027D83F39|nr:metallophosphoesterase [Brevundimonas sp. SORGH_AS_0993]
MIRFRPFLTSLAATVTLFGAAVDARAEVFTVAVVSDTQHYSNIQAAQPRGEDTFVQQMTYLADTRHEKNLAFVTFVGDIVQHGDGQFRTRTDAQDGVYQTFDTRAEWDIANRAIQRLAETGVPFGMVPGNHDYDSAYWWSENGGRGEPRPLRGGRVWGLYFGPESRFFADRPWYGGASPNGLNSYQTFKLGDHAILHLSLEMDPPPATLDWAQGVLDAHPGMPVMMTTHEWLRPDAAERSNGLADNFPGAPNLSPDQVWDRFIRRNPRIFMVLCGHNYTRPIDGVSNGENLRIDANDAGDPVYQLIQDYQGNTRGPDGAAGSANGGAGWLRFMAFDTEAKTIHFYTYSTLLDRYAGRNGEATFGVEPQRSDFTLPFPPQLLKALSD